MVAERTAAELAAMVGEAFGWDDAVVSRVTRGATARIWQVAIGGARYALKEGRGDPPPAPVAATEVAFIDDARAAGIQVPAIHADRAGRWVVPGPGGSWLRLYDWVDVRPVDLESPATPTALGELLARLHRHAPPMAAEPDGSPPDAWYERPPDPAALQAAIPPGSPWSARLAERMADLPGLLELVGPTDPDRLVRCHRDLHPGNILVDGTGGLVVMDQDDLGPADPARELARALFDWWSDPSPDLGAMEATNAAYRAAGGPARVRHPSDFTMLVAQRLNFLLLQLRLAVDPATRLDDRAWAEQELDESLRILPTVGQIEAVLATLG